MSESFPVRPVDSRQTAFLKTSISIVYSSDATFALINCTGKTLSF